MRACACMLVAAALAPGAASGDTILLPPQGQVAGGGNVRIDLLITNEDTAARTYTVDGRALTRRARRRYTGGQPGDTAGILPSDPPPPRGNDRSPCCSACCSRPAPMQRNPPAHWR